MAIDFPNSPANGQYFTSGGTTWVYNTNRWDLYRNIGLTYQGSQPAGEFTGQIWIDSDDNKMYVYTGSAWALVTAPGSTYQSASPSGPSTGQLWVDSDDNLLYVYTGSAWINAGGSGGATGGGSNKVFYENDITVTTDYTITTNKNAVSAGPVTINSGVTVTVPSGSVWSIV